MNLSTRARYAMMAMSEIAGRGGDAPVTLGEIAAAQQLSQCYLEQLFARLRRAGLVASVRGAAGGYRLARAAGDIAVAEIMQAVDEPIRVTRCAADAPGCLRGAAGEPVICVTHDLWSELGRQVDLFLSGITLADVVEGRVLGRAVPVRPAALVPA